VCAVNFSELFPDPRGRWFSVLAAAGVPPQFLRTNVPCPWCGGRDRFSFGDLGVGAFHCRKCGAHGNGYDFIGRWLGIPDFNDCSHRVREILKAIPTDTLAGSRSLHRPARAGDGAASEKQLSERHEIWERGIPIKADDLVGRYLISRVGFVPEAPDALRKLPDKYTTWMVARATHPNAWGTLHYTDMNPDASLRRRRHEGPRPIGSAVRLMPIGDRGILGIAEGIETALSASVLFNVPTWAALDKHGLENFLIPDDVVALMIFADNDADGGGLMAAKKLQARCEVRSEVLMPDKVGTDWNDVHASRGLKS
jgi:putative DNA primase/helicase